MNSVNPIERLSNIDLDTQQITESLEPTKKYSKSLRVFINLITFGLYGRYLQSQMITVAGKIKELAINSQDQAAKSLVGRLITKLANSRHIEALRILQSIPTNVPAPLPHTAPDNTALAKNASVNPAPVNTAPANTAPANTAPVVLAATEPRRVIKPMEVTFPMPEQASMLFGRDLHNKSHIFHYTQETTVGDLRQQYVEMRAKECVGADGTTPKPSDIRIIFCGKQLPDDMPASELRREGLFHIVMRKTSEAIEAKTADLLFAQRQTLPEIYHDFESSAELFNFLQTTTLSMYDRLVRGKLEGHEKDELKNLRVAIIALHTTDGEIREELDRICQMINVAMERFDTIVAIKEGKAYQKLLQTIEEALDVEKVILSDCTDKITGHDETVAITFTFDNTESEKYIVNKALLSHFVPPLKDLLDGDSIADHSAGIPLPVSSLEIINPLLDYINRKPVDFSAMTNINLISLAYTAHGYNIPGLEAKAVEEIMHRAKRNNSGEIVALFQGDAKLPGLLGQLKETSLFQL